MTNTDRLEGTADKPKRKSTDTIGRAGEHYVAAELNRRGVYASPFSGNVPGIDIVATDHLRERMVYIQVKTKRTAGNWHMSLGHGWIIDPLTRRASPGESANPTAAKGTMSIIPTRWTCRDSPRSKERTTTIGLSCPWRTCDIGLSPIRMSAA